ncbi:MAG: ABC transporter ATP-binding protein [Minisyncoccia bacterium]
MDDERRPKFTWAQKRKALSRQLNPYKGVLTLLSIAGIFSAAANGVIPYITGRFFDTLVNPHIIAVPLLGSYQGWSVLLATWFVAQIIANGVSWLIDRQSRLLTTELEIAVQANAFTHLLTLPIAFHKKNRSGEISEMVSRAAWQLARTADTIVSLAPQFLTIFIGVAISFSMRPSLAAILLAGVAIYLLVLVRILPKTAFYQEEGIKIWNRAYGDGADAYTNVQTVKQASAETYESERIHSAFFKNALPLWMKMEYAWSAMNFSQRVIVTLTQGIILFYSVALVSNGSITIGELIAFNAYAGMIMGPFVSLGGQWQTIQNGLTSLVRSEIIFETPSETYEPEQAVRLPELAGNVEFKDVHFSYEEGQPEVLKGVSFRVRAGEVVALVGETGVGKSTTAELISGYYFPTQGEVLIDGHDVKTVNLNDLRRGIGIVPQEVVLFNASIMQNIRYGKPGATDAEVEEAAKKAHADIFIEQFPKKYEQEVGERGIKLSVGQKQRVAIARAILRNPRILILDEPTSALDAETEKYVSKSFDELMRGRTTFIIAHRLSTVRKADSIIVLKQGEIAEQGTHDELVKIQDGVYRHFYELHIGLHE